MKKLFLLMILVVAGLATMAQKNVTPKEMVRDGYRLCCVQNNEVIPDVELQQLLGEDAFNNYCGGRKVYKVGNSLKNGGWAAFGGGLAMIAVGTGLLLDEHSNPNETMKYAGVLVLDVGMLLFINGNILIPTGYGLRGMGAGKISRVAEDYNQKAGFSNVSFRVSPSVMSVNIPQSQSNVALGMTFSVNF